VFLSYALTMIDDWQAALNNAMVDAEARRYASALWIFYVSARRPRAGFVRHAAWERWLWRRWFCA